eukprot:5773506-Amphidinium_carterae.1
MGFVQETCSSLLAKLAAQDAVLNALLFEAQVSNNYHSQPALGRGFPLPDMRKAKQKAKEATKEATN